MDEELNLENEVVQEEEAAPEETEAVPPPVSAPDTTELDALKAELAALKSQLTPPPKQEEDLTELMYSDPAAFAAKIRQQATQEAIRQMAPAIMPTYMEHATRTVAGDDKHAQEFARKHIATGRFDPNNPEDAEILRRASSDYAREKTPVKANVRSERGEMPAPTIDHAIREHANIFASIAGVTLTDDEIREALAG